MFSSFYSAPALVDLSVTNRCNLHCPFCFADSKDSSPFTEELSVDELFKLFSDLENINVLRVALTGGEPFLRQDIMEIITKFSSFNFAKTINTNGTLINEEIAMELSNLNIDRICISLDGSNSKIHNRIRGLGTFSKVIRGIELLKENEVPVSTLFTLNKYNVENLLECIKFNEKIGMDYMTVMMLCPTGRASDGKLLPNKDQWYPILLKLSQMLKNDEINLKFKIVPPNESPIWWQLYFPLEFYDCTDFLQYWPFNENPNTNSIKREISCQAGVKACSIIQNGDVYGCDFMIGNDELKAGNIRSSTFKEIWDHSSVFKQLRNLSFDQIEGKCKTCPHIWCGGGCRSAAYNYSGDIFGSDESCYFIGGG